MHLRGKYPFKQNKEIKEILEQKKNSYVNEDEFVDIVSYMYNKEDSETLIHKIKSSCLDSSQNNNEFLIGFNEFQKVSFFKKNHTHQKKIILSFQLKNHEKFLSPFTKIFKNIDLDKDGIINEVRCFLRN